MTPAHIKKAAGIALIAVASLDLIFGGTNPVLPDVIANKLTQQTDLILIAAGGLLVFVL